jgi:8-oxo-dGTP diphosphatase
VGHFCVNCGTELVPRTIEGREVEACPRDDFVLWHDPKVSTAVVVVVEGGVLLGRRSIEPGYGLWCLPGGYVNDDESPLDAAVRECMEEINATVDITGLIGVYHIAKTGAPSIIGIAYSARLADGARATAGSEMLELAVFPLDAMPPLAFSSHRTVMAEYLKSPELRAAARPRRDGAAARPGTRPSRSREPRRPRRTR